MMKKLLAGICTLTLAVLVACNINSQPTPMSLSQIAIDTIVAETMQAVESASPTAPTVLNTPASLTPVVMTPSPSATPMANIATVTPSPSTIPGVPDEPSSLSYQYQCPSGKLTTTLTWKNVADNETGYHVYRNRALIATLPANSTTYTDTATVTPGTLIVYAVTAFNDAGDSAAGAAIFLCK